MGRSWVRIHLTLISDGRRRERDSSSNTGLGVVGTKGTQVWGGNKVEPNKKQEELKGKARRERSWPGPDMCLPEAILAGGLSAELDTWVDQAG